MSDRARRAAQLAEQARQMCWEIERVFGKGEHLAAAEELYMVLNGLSSHYPETRPFAHTTPPPKDKETRMFPEPVPSQVSVDPETETPKCGERQFWRMCACGVSIYVDGAGKTREAIGGELHTCRRDGLAAEPEAGAREATKGPTPTFAREVTYEQAVEAALTLIDAAFNNGRRRVQFRIPVDPSDTDVTLMDYLRAHREREERLRQMVIHQQTFIGWPHDSEHCELCAAIRKEVEP